jgi:hypothetical protein
MLLKFTDDFVNTIMNGKLLLGEIQHNISKQEPYLGESKVLDRLYAQSVLISGIIDYLENSDNKNYREDEGLLMCLRSAIDKNLCRKPVNRVKDKTDYHKPMGVPRAIAIPPPEPVFPVIPGFEPIDLEELTNVEEGRPGRPGTPGRPGLTPAPPPAPRPQLDEDPIVFPTPGGQFPISFPTEEDPNEPGGWNGLTNFA